MTTLPEATSSTRFLPPLLKWYAMASASVGFRLSSPPRLPPAPPRAGMESTDKYSTSSSRA
eukprot:CAMPEP_0203814996 /NCGR_PEP_ID=MMETSP0115-20131106/7270_1 /ASSEMBLY_ACC=CAM_ASM_000227 /TAXON_ID=33651 /ORGANISM="Bicosoecid sp, Strain ms1" /LENGTH=60 /DNA_ID=CAMNT_0050723883 /DNA_START=115 /DNA_END=294 /DNA_ORIENTATION=+